MKYDTIIIGAGMSGLAAGIRLAHFDKKVLICEQHYREGGLNSYYDRHNYRLETGLHAMTNFVSRGASKSLPLMKILRQLRIPYDALELREQKESSIVFPGNTLVFNNDYSKFKQSVAEQFPKEKDNLARLDKLITEYDATKMVNGFSSARKVIAKYIKDPLLVEMIFCPLMYYGSAVENDMDFPQFVLMYRSIFHEGLCRPAENGIRHILDLLKHRYCESGGEFKLNCHIKKIKSRGEKAYAVETDSGDVIEAKNILSSAGAYETFKLCEKNASGIMLPLEGQLAFLESIVIPKDNFDFKTDKTIIFFNNSKKFKYTNPEALCNYDSGIICFPQNFQFKGNDTKPDSMIRVCVMANSRSWHTMYNEEYELKKEAAEVKAIKAAEKILGVKNIVAGAKLTDCFTPKTITRFTGRVNGAIYGSPTKYKDGRTHLQNLYLCGTDQGFLGITGAMLSGISIANTHMMID